MGLCLCLPIPGSHVQLLRPQVITVFIGGGGIDDAGDMPGFPQDELHWTGK